MRLLGLSAAMMAALFSTTAMAQMMEVAGPGADPECFKPLTADTKYFQWPAKEGPYRIALVNGYIANDWRVQMIQIAKAYAAQPEVAKNIEEFKVISVGEDIAGQIAAANNFIDQGFDAVIVNANNNKAFGGVIQKAKDAGVVFISFDNTIEDPNHIAINVDQVGIGRASGEHVLKETEGDVDILFVRGVAGQPVDGFRAEGFYGAIEASGRKVNVTEVEGRWDPGTGQKVTADAIAAGGNFDAIYVQGGSQGAAQAMLDAGKFIVPMAGEDENAFRQLCNDNHDKGMRCMSGGTGPAQSSIAVKTAIAALQGQVIPQSIALPTSLSYSPYKVGTEVFPDLPGSLFTGNNFEACNIGFTVEEISRQTGENN